MKYRFTFKNVLRRAALIAMTFCTVMLSVHGAQGGGSYSPMRDENVFRRHDNAYRKIALTFDDGPHPVYTAQILDLLREYDARATFFVIGSNAAQYPDLLQREAAEGHEIGNHTYTHCRMTKATRASLGQEILQCENVVEELTDERPDLFRPPEGKCTAMISDLAKSLDYRIVLWRIDTLDWKHRPADVIADEVLSGVTSGDIILFHDYVGGKSQTVEALRIILPALREQGYDMVTVSELLCSD